MTKPTRPFPFPDALFVLLVACGAKSGLDVPDAMEIAEPPSPPPLCIEVPDTGAVAELTLPATLAVIDLMFLIDATVSMDDEIENVRDGLRGRVVPGVRAAIPDAAFGVAFLGEFPVEPHIFLGDESTRPYELRMPITADVTAVEGALERPPRWANADFPEAQVEALYQVATGEGFPPWIPASIGCSRGGEGGACFRTNALPVVMLITDAAFHNGPPGIAPEDPYLFEPAPHRYEDAVDALGTLGARVIGLGASDGGEVMGAAHLRAIARDTGAVDVAGRPLVRDIGSAGEIGDGIVAAVEQLAQGVPLDVDAIVEDVPGDPFDATLLVRALRPFRADPPSGVGAIDAEGFRAVAPGTRVTFEVEIDGAARPAGAARVAARVVFRAFRRSRLGAIEVLLVFGPEGCDGE